MTKEFKVGDQVFDDVLCKWGRVIDVNDIADYPVTVEFNNNLRRQYTFSGVYDFVDSRPTLHHEVPDWCKTKISSAHIGKLVAVRDTTVSPWTYRVLISHNPDEDSPYGTLGLLRPNGSRTYVYPWVYARELTAHELARINLPEDYYAR